MSCPGATSRLTDEGRAERNARLDREHSVSEKYLRAADAVKRSRSHAARARKLLRLLLEDPSLGRTIGEAIHNDALRAAEWAARAVRCSVEADDARRDLENAAKGEPKP